MASRAPVLPLLFALIAVGIALFPLVGDSFYIRLVAKIMVLAILAMSLDLLVGYTGLISLGHAAFSGTAGYVAAALINKAGITDLAPLLAASLAASGAAALLVGWISVRTSGIYFIMITLALGQMLFFFFHDVAFWGGADGVNLTARPVLAVGEATLLDLSVRMEVYYTALACLVAVYLLLSTILSAPFGQVLRGIRINEARTRALGHDVQRYKLACFVLSGLVAGLAGFLEVARGGFISPAHVNWHESAMALIVVILGGMGTLVGPVVGAFALVLLEDWVADLTDHWKLVIGLFVIAVVLFLPDGLVGPLKTGKCRLLPRLRQRVKEPSRESVRDA
ncbi:branched-chain amino acid ABC transporter permease [Azospirillum sp. TSO22-1]|uniref:branched-chain amino acid ABC transporter permease n=1 Tax=Azospirillum sp. TSO22-1 TaxID=716789 RepID=UPI000D656134|nr:branched-chain amino acid ABC transporter permease [Azospirillum sp. TSO22-1]